MISSVLCLRCPSWVILQFSPVPLSVCVHLFYLVTSYLFSSSTLLLPFPSFSLLVLCLALLICFSACFLRLIMLFPFFLFLPCLSIDSLLTLLTSCCLQTDLLTTHHLVSLFYLSSFFQLLLSSFQQWKLLKACGGSIWPMLALILSLLFWMLFCHKHNKQNNTKSFLKANTA